jgi:hypothetical protein
VAVIAYRDDPVLTLDRIKDGNIVVTLKVVDKNDNLETSINKI